MPDFSLQEIADWQINVNGNGHPQMGLPAMQRGYVWSASQVEGIWDSLVRRLPVGSFLACPFDDRLVNQNQNHPEWLLLDGQQRATAIALAFVNPWKDKPGKDDPSDYPMALWLDLARPHNDYVDRAFMFRLVTRAHPWGYSWDSSGRLEPEKRRNALREFQENIRLYNGENEDDDLPEEAQYPGLSVAFSWPWDARTPLPFPLLCEAVRTARGRRTWQELLVQKLNGYDYWQMPMPTGKNTPCWKERIIDILEKKNSEEYDRLNVLVEALPQVFENTIPCLLVHDTDINDELARIHKQYDNGAHPDDENNEDTRPGAVECVFNRINSAGTRLEGDELIYSIYKAIYPETMTLVERVSDNAFMRPARLVALSARLVRARQRNAQGDMPAALEATRFRGYVYNDQLYRDHLQNFIENQAEELFQKAKNFLAGGERLLRNDEDFRLGAILLEILYRESPDLSFFFLHWLSQNLERNFQQNTRKTILGAMTAIAFFAPDQGKFVKRLWRCRNDRWWIKNIINNLMTMERGKLIMFPLPSPGALDAILAFNGEGKNPALPARNGYIQQWRKWTMYGAFQDYPLNRRTAYAQACGVLLPQEEDVNDDDVPDAINTAWCDFWYRLIYQRNLVLYAQRYWLQEFFPGYNPASMDQREDGDRPYDWDHIFPQNLAEGGSILTMWRADRRSDNDWINSIGNFRAWPMELNRSDQDALPAEKLNALNPDINNNRWYEILYDNKTICQASCINSRAWTGIGNEEASLPQKEKRQTIREALSRNSNLSNALLQAVTGRIRQLYKYWYETLNVGESFGASRQHR